jgi:HJR/Mrr/RecB family endonuclease
MVDWLTHSLVGWITGKTIKQEISFVIIGSLIPDISKFFIIFNWFLKNDTKNFFLPIHTPIGAILIACVFAYFFHDIIKAFILFGVGIATHFILDLFLLNVSGGMLLLFPVSWDEWQINLIQSEDYMITIYAILAAVTVYSIYYIYEKRKSITYDVSLSGSNTLIRNERLSNMKKAPYQPITPVKTIPKIYYVDNHQCNQTDIQKLNEIKHTRQEKKISNIDTMNISEFEKFLEDFFTKIGYSIEQKKRNHKKTIDFILKHQGERVAVKVKFYKKSVGNKTIQEANTTRRYNHCQKALVITNSTFTLSAKKLAEHADVELWDGKKLKEKIKTILDLHFI